MSAEKPLWQPSAEAIAASPMSDFMAWCSTKFGLDFEGYDAFYDWSISERADFWSAVWDYCGVIGDKGSIALVDNGHMLDARFFPEASLNFAENLLKEKGPSDALVFRGEDKVQYRWSWDDLHATVSKLQQGLKAQGIGTGDRVAAMMPNMPETYALMLAVTSLGAIWSSCSPDFGEQGIIDRFGQIEPKLFIACDAYWYNGKKQDVADKVRAVAPKLKAPVLVVHYAGEADALAASLESGVTFDAFIAPFTAKPVEYVRLPFSHPALHPVFLRHHWRSQMHRPFGWWHAFAASERTCLPLRPQEGRPAVLFHHLRLDDVELAGLGSGRRGNTLPL